MTAPEPPRSRPLCRILLTLAGLVVIAALGVAPKLLGQPTGDGLLELAKFAGRFHLVVLHLPIGILVWVLAHECMAAFGCASSSSRSAMGLAAGSAVLASLLGILLYFSTPEYDARLAQRHLDRGVAFTCLAIATWLVKIWVDAAGGRGSFVYRVMLLGSAILMTAASHDGASLTHGSGYLTEYAPAPLRQTLGLPSRSNAQTAPQPVPAADPVVYTDIIGPILESKCYSCHNVEKRKGRYRMDDYELLLAGGKEGKPGIIPGDPAASNVIVRIELPVDDEEHMPPEGKKDLEEHELLLLKWWITHGASKDATLAQLPQDDAVKAALAKPAASAD